jgi:hypothetical protein
MAQDDEPPKLQLKSHALSKHAVPLPEDSRHGEWHRWELERMNAKFCRAMSAKNNKQVKTSSKG